MKLLLAHNRYRQAGGEDAVFALEANLLRRYGHDVVQYEEDNRQMPAIHPLRLAGRTIWSSQSRRRMAAALSESGATVAHFHNTVPLISPAAYYACGEVGVAVVQTLHNYRLACPAATFVREGLPCESCLGRAVPWPGVLHGCYRNDHAASATLAAMSGVHRLLGTWRRKIDVYVALTEFARQKLIEGGLPPSRVVVKPNCLDEDPGHGAHRGGYALFVGRLTGVKGVRTLVEAWRGIAPDRTLKVAGAGELGSLAEDAPPSIEWLGAVPRARVLELMQDAAFLVFPSEWYEGFPMTLVEAFATGLPVLCSRLGAMARIVDDGRTGVHFAAGDVADLAERATWAFEHQGVLETMGRNARREFERRYTPDSNHEMLMTVYDTALARARA